MRWFALSLFVLVGCSRTETVPNPDATRVAPPVAQAAAPAEQTATDIKGETPTTKAAAPAPNASSDRCPPNMILVEGMSCPNPKQECVDWAEDPVKFPYARCRKYKETAECNSARVPMAFCIDRNEYARQGEELPEGDISWTNAKKTCEASGKRLCQESEWTFACEGEQMLPYPYGTERNPAICNFEQQDLVEKGKLRDLRQPVESNPQCLSPFGVHNMVGNIDEWVVLDKPHYSQRNNGQKMMSGLKGGWWGPLRNRCRPVTVDHDEYFHELQTGFRCCADAKGKLAQNEN